MTTTLITLAEAVSSDIPTFKTELQDAFAIAFVQEFGPLSNGPIPSDGDLDRSIAAPGAIALHILCDGSKVGGAVLSIDEETKHNSLDLFFLSSKQHGRGLGYEAWTAIERRYPETLVWHTLTPYFEKRNIHFYVNKCGFKIVEFFGKHHPDPHGRGPDDGETFRFEKVMRGRGTMAAWEGA